MSNIARWKAAGGEWVRYADHLMETTRLTGQNSKYWAYIERVKNVIDHLTSERNEARAEVERLTARQTEMETHITGLTAELHRTRADGIELRWVQGEVEQLTAQRDAAQVEVERLKNAIDHLTSERDEARDERDAVQRERERVQALLWVRERELPTLQLDQPAQNLDMANGQATLDTSRPTDETIWREVFVRSVNTPSEFKVAFADWALAEYRKRWPR